MRLFFQTFERIFEIGPQTIWERGLYPFLRACGFFYGLAGHLRSLLYCYRVIPSYRAAVPVVSVGNLAVGGTGKTPVVDYIAKYFLACGKKTAVVSRGYGREEKNELKVVCAGSGPLVSAELAGDEPFLLAQRNPSLVIIAAVKRSRGVAVAVEDHGAEVVILDDGFQHLAVQRNLNIVLLDALRPLGNGRVLPGGPLREFPSALNRGDLVIFTRNDANCRNSLQISCEILNCRHILSSSFVSLAGDFVDLASLKNLRAGAFAGIASPEKFFSDLRSAGLNIKRTVSFQDHVKYGKMEFDRLSDMGRDVDYLITTEKDAVKLRQEELPLICYAAPLSLVFSEPGKLEAVLDALL